MPAYGKNLSPAENHKRSLGFLKTLRPAGPGPRGRMTRVWYIGSTHSTRRRSKRPSARTRGSLARTSFWSAGHKDLRNMTSAMQAILSSVVQSTRPSLFGVSLLWGFIYIRGWAILHRLTPALFPEMAFCLSFPCRLGLHLARSKILRWTPCPALLLSSTYGAAHFAAHGCTASRSARFSQSFRLLARELPRSLARERHRSIPSNWMPIAQ